MTDKEAVQDALNRLPENVSLDEIAEQLQVMSSFRRARAEILPGKLKAIAMLGN